MNQPLVKPENKTDILEGFAPVALNSNSNISNNSLNTFQSIDTSDKSSSRENKDKEKDSSAQQSNTTSTNENNDTAVSDERCKQLFGSEDLLAAIKDIDAYRFKYKPGADKIDPDATPDKEHTGVMAQELKANPVTESAVEEDPLSGFLKVNTKELTMTTFALVTEMAKRIRAIESKLNME